MKSVDVFAICYNEELMLPHFIKHYKDNFDANITIYDNHSTDRSQEIIKDSGCNLLTYDSNNQIRDDLYLGIKNECWKKSKAQWAIVVDADELLEVKFDLSRCTIVNTKGFDMIGEPPSRLGVANIRYNKAVMFRPNQFAQIGYGVGAHSCNPTGKIVGSREIANLLHYKYVSEDYVYNRHLMYESRLSDFNRQYQFGIEYQDVQLKKIQDKFIDLRSKVSKVI